MARPPLPSGFVSAALVVAAAAGLAVAVARAVDAERAVAEGEARAVLRAAAREGAAVLAARAQEALRIASSATAPVAADAEGVILTPAPPTPFRSLEPPAGLSASAAWLLAEAARAEADPADAARAIPLLRDAGRAADARARAVAWARLAAAARRAGDADAEREAAAALLAACAAEDRGHAVEAILARVLVDADRPALEDDLLLRVGSRDEGVALRVLDAVAPGPGAAQAVAARRERLRLRDRAAATLARRGARAEGAWLDAHGIAAWAVREGGGVGVAFAAADGLPPGTTAERTGEPDPSADLLVERAAAPPPLLGATVRAAAPRAAVEARARAGGVRAALALGLLLLGTGGAAVLAVRAARAEARAARERAELVTRVGHELRTPLALVRMYAETVALGRTSGEDEARGFAQIAAREAALLTAMVDQALDLARLDAGGTPEGVRRAVDLAALAREVAESHRPLVESENGTLVVEASAPLPVQGDEPALRGAVANLVANAVRHGGARAVVVRAAAEGAAARIEVLDRGPGLPAGMEDRVFERFVRGPGASARGAGLGLAVVRETAVAHGGSVRAAGREGGGAAVSFTIPLARDRREEGP